MSKKTASCWACLDCGASYTRWVGKCGACNNWNTIVEESEESLTKFNSLVKKSSVGGTAKASGITAESIKKLETLKADISEATRVVLQNSELNRVFGGGIVTGSVILVAGEPGVGKSTLMLNIAHEFGGLEHDVVYASGEESANQIRLRAMRIGASSEKVRLVSNMNLTSLMGVMNVLEEGSVMIIDSIQTVYSEEMPSAPGSVMQVRVCTHELTLLAKQRNIFLFIVGHINKDGQIAGPKVLEHIVDVVLYFEMGMTDDYRMIRNMKNRFGSVQEIGIFTMTKEGLKEVKNPSEMFLSTLKVDNVGMVAFAGIEGSRVIFTQTETLVMASYMSSPRRAVIGWDQNRLAIIVALMSSKLGCKLFDKEIYLNITGGLKITEPAADLAVLMSLYSSYLDVTMPYSLVCFGEISLSGEVKQVYFMENRIKEAIRLGFKTIACPVISKDLKQFALDNDVEVNVFNSISQIKNCKLLSGGRASAD